MAISTTDFDQWSQKAHEVERTDNPLSIPFQVAIDEAVQTAAFLRTYWAPADNRPGLVRVKGRVPLDNADKILSLVSAVHEAQTRLVMLLDPLAVRRADRARVLLNQIESAIEFTLDDGVTEAADLQLANIKAYHSGDSERISAYAQALRDYAALGRSIQARIVEADSGFDPKLLDEAEQLAVTMEKEAATPTTNPAAVDAAMVLRNRLLVLLTNEVSIVRRAAAHVFEDFPDIVRQVTSAYERRRRAASRKAKVNTPPVTTEPAAPAPKATV